MKNIKFVIIGGLVLGLLAIVLTIFKLSDKDLVSYNVFFNSNGGSNVESQIVPKGGQATKPIDPIKKGYYFIEWQYEGKTYDFSQEVTSNLILTAKYEKKEPEIIKYLVKFDSDGGTTIPNQIVEAGNAIVKPQDPEKANHKFKGWYYNGQLYDFQNRINSDVELIAQWELVVVQPTPKPNNNGNNTNNNANVNIPAPASPTLRNVTLTACGDDCGEYIPTLVDGKYSYDLGIVKTQYGSVNSYGVTGYTIYEKTSSGYTEIATYAMTGSDIVEVSVKPGEKKEYVAKVYVTNSKGENIYSDYSNVVTIDHTKPQAPTLRNVTLTACGEGCGEYIPTLVDGKYSYDLGIVKTQYGSVNSYGVTGYTIYEKTSSGYTEIATYAMTGSDIVEVSVKPGEKKEYVAKVYVTNSKGENIYSDYSNVVTIDHTKPQAPTLRNVTLTACGEGCGEYIPTLVDGKYSYDLGIVKTQYGSVNSYGVTGYTIYEKTSSGYTEIATYAMTGSDIVEVSVKPGEKKEYVAKVYATNSKGENIYSDYSNVVIIDHS